jgi:hypothetical protein
MAPGAATRLMSMIFKVSLGATMTFCGLRPLVHETCGVHGRDVGMVDSGESGDLTPEAPDDALPFVVGVEEFRTNEIEGDQTPQMQVGAFPYLAHRSVTGRRAHLATISDALSPSHPRASPMCVRNRSVPDHHGG